MCVRGDNTLMIEIFNYCLQIQEITTLHILYNLVYYTDNVVMLLHSGPVNVESDTNTANYLEAMRKCRHC